MNIVIVHYHLNRGGVTQVIANHLRGLNQVLYKAAGWRIALIYGGRRTGWPDELPGQLDALEVTLEEVPEVDYEQVEPASRVDLAERLQATLNRLGFHPEATVIHAHNHALGKNLSLPGSLNCLARSGYPLLLQIHDFAEDLRASVYGTMCDRLADGNPNALALELYPQAEHIHYAVLNSRDEQFLRQATFAPSRLHMLPNPIMGVRNLPPRNVARSKLHARFGVPLDDRFVLYPVRGITRKNLGEMLLWSAVTGDGIHFGTTLAPLNQLELPNYRRWTKLADQLELKCLFETGSDDGLSFAENLAASDLILTTSLAEGFGMIFLEPWLAGRSLVGRDLPEITVDFVRNGMRLEALRPSLAVPIGWVGEERFLASFESAYGRVLNSYRRDLPVQRELRCSIMTLVEDGQIDFGRLTAELQGEVIQRVQASTPCRNQLREQNPWIGEALLDSGHDAAEMIAHNERVVRQHYSLEGGGQKLVNIYRQLLASDRAVLASDRGSIVGETLLRAFLDPLRFRPLGS